MKRTLPIPHQFNPPTASTLYPTMNSMQEVEEAALNALPIQTANELYAILKLQQNTILNLLQTKK